MSTSIRSFPVSRLVLVALALALVAMVSPGRVHAVVRVSDGVVGRATTPKVLPPGSMPFGKSYGEWSAEQWNWLLSIPTSQSPAIDFTGANGAVGQSGEVWFLAGSFCPEPPTPCSDFTVTRYLTVPAGKALFFPILDAECSTLEGNGTTDAELRDCAKYFMDLGTGMSCDIDGVPVENLDAYRVQSPMFTFGPLPADNIFGAPPGVTSPSVSDGVFLMIAPMSVGPHTIHFTGAIPDFGFGMDITYHLTVAGGRGPVDVTSMSGSGDAPARTSWGAVKVIYR